MNSVKVKDLLSVFLLTAAHFPIFCWSSKEELSDESSGYEDKKMHFIVDKCLTSNKLSLLLPLHLSSYTTCPTHQTSECPFYGLQVVSIPESHVGNSCQ